MFNLNNITHLIDTHPIGRIFQLGQKKAVWKRATEIAVGAKIATEKDGKLEWDEIVSIKKVGRERVYDIEVEGTHNFVGNGIVAHNTIITGDVGIGTTAPTTALHVGTSAETHTLSTGDALISSDLELDGVLYLDGGTISNSAGTASLVLSATPTTTANSLSAGNWLIENTANLGQAALMVNQTKSSDLFTASASGTPKFTIANTGAITSAIGNWTSQVADSATAVGFTFNTSNTLSTQGSKLLSFQNLGTEKMYLDKDGNLYVSGTVLSGNGTSMLLTNKSGGVVANRALVILDSSNNSSFTTTTTPYNKAGFGVVVGVGLGVTNDADGDGVCDANDICMVAYGGEVEVTVKNASTAVKGDYLFTSDTAGSAVASAKQFDGLVGVISNTAGAGSGYVKMIFKVQPQVTAAAAIDKTTKHNEYWLYADQYQAVGEGSNTDTNLLQRGLAFDTFSDSTKIDSANTTASFDTNTQKTGLIGGQTLATSTTDNDGQTYLGSNTVNDTYYYDRTRDSSPEVQVELGIDPNWYNGVTLSVATSSASYSQNSVIASGAKQSNPNLSTSYNGSLVKVTGTDSTPRTIYITIKSPTTFDWTNYQGDAGTGVTMTFGTAQALGTTGVSATFTNARYNTGDVFKVASWFIEAESATRGAKQQFPERSNVIATASSVDIIDADTQKLWMRFSQGTNYAIGVDANNDPSSANMLNGKAYISTNGSAATGLYTLDFAHDAAFKQNATDYRLSDTALTGRNSTNTYNVINTSNILVNITANDVSAAVIPNQPTQEVTVSGWGYVVGDGVNSVISETVNLPYKFNTTPIILATTNGFKASAVPTSLASCTDYNPINTVETQDITQSNFLMAFQTSTGAATSASNYYCYTWTATGQVSPRQYVGAATDAGVTVINETDSTAYSYSDVTNDHYNAVSLTSAGRMYALNETQAQLEKWRDIASNTASETNGTYDKMWDQTSTPALTATTPTIQVSASDLYVTQKTSTINSNNDTIYVGTNLGTSVIQDNENWPTANDGAEETTGSVKYYTKDYVTEEMVGNVQGMWGFNSALTDSSVKAATITAAGATITYPTGVRNKGINITVANGTATTTTIAATYSMGVWVKETAGWTHYVKTNAGTYINGVLSSTAFTNRMTWATTTVTLVAGTQDVDEMFATNTTMTPGQIKNMYQVGYRALQSHATTLGGGAADTNQQLGGTTNVIGAAQPDLNNQFMYVGTNSTTLGAVSKIDLNSDTNIKTYNSSANVPTGGALLIDEDTKSLAVGYNLEAVGSATTGVKTMGVDNSSTSLTGNFIGKTITTAESFTQAYLWAQYVTDSSDSSNSVTVWASNDNGASYSQCNLTNTDTSRSPSEYEYFCQFNAAGSSLKTKFVMARGSSKTNTWVSKYGITWIDSNAIAGSANGSGLFTGTNASVANGSYIDVAHNQNSNDLVTNGWVYNTATSKWEIVGDSGDATGGTVTYKDGYTIHTFTSSGTFTPVNAGNVEYLVVGGGGGSGSNGGGGGGAGGFRTATGFAVTAQGYTVTVGGGGAGNSGTGSGASGSDSVFSTITSTGGGGGGNGGTGLNGLNGGSGGGAHRVNTAGLGNTPSTSPSQGNNGGIGLSTGGSNAGGGGGAGAVGSNATGTDTGGIGGAGTASSISGSSVVYAGGGGGGGTTAGGAGGSGGGGAGGASGVAGSSGTANTGGGGGGGGNFGATTSGGNGGSGIVIVRYLTNSLSAFKITQQDTNTVRLYNYSGATQNLRLDVITGGLGRNAGTVSLAPAAADVDSAASTNSIWINKTGSGGNLLKLQQSGTDILNISQNGGNAALMLDQRLGGDIFTASASGIPKFVITNAGNVGIGTTAPSTKLDVVVDDAVNNDVTNLLTLTHTTTGTVDGADPYTKTLLHMNGVDASTSFIDETGKSWTAGGNAQIDTAQSKFDGASGLFDGTGDYISTPDSNDFYFGTGAFTIDFWVRFNALPTDGNIKRMIGQYQATPPFWQFFVRNTSGTYSWELQNYNGSYTVALVKNSSGLSTGTWYHVALVRNSNSWYIFQDGVQQGTTDTNSNEMTDIGAALYVASMTSSDATTMHNGWLDEFRISKGIARWTANFTPPTSTYSYVNGIGAGILFNGEDSAGNIENAGKISSVLTTVTNGSEASNIIFETRTAGGSLIRTMRLGESGNLTIKGTLTQSGAPDIAENVIVTDPSIGAGDVVMIDPDYSGTEAYNKAAAKKANVPYSNRLLGVVSTNPGIVLNAPKTAVNDGQRSQANERPLVLSGRVPVKIDPDSEPIEVGDFLTSSDKPGLAMKATKAGYTVGKALESWTSGEPSTIEIFVNLGYYDPDLALTDSGDILLATNSANIYNVSTTNGIVTKIGAFAEASIAKLKAGIGSFRQVETSLISPIANTDLIVDLQPDDSQVATQLIIKGENDEVVTSFDAKGNATISGTLYADKIESTRLSEIEDLLREVETNQLLLTEAANWNTDTAMDSTSLTTIADSGQFKDLFVTGQAAMTSLFVSDNFTTKNINSLTEPLSIQSLASAPLEIMAGKIIIDTNGNTKFLGDVEIAGNLKINNIIVANNIDPIATESGTLIEGEITTNATAGTATLPAGLTELIIKNEKLKINSLIYVTPVSSTQNKVLYVKSKDVGVFTIGFNEAIDTDVEFNWWIIELQGPTLQN